MQVSWKGSADDDPGPVQVTAVQVESARQISWQASGEGMSSEREVAKEGSQVKPAVRQEG